MSELSLLSAAKRTSRSKGGRSGFDPERTFSAILGSSEEAMDGRTPRSRWFSVDREIDPAAAVSTQL
jgi:hypothetical protein